MSFFNHPWDDTVAGLRPDSTAIRRLTSSKYAAASTDRIPVTGSITILRPAAAFYEPSSPATGPDSPLTPTSPGEDWRRPRRKTVAEPRNPTVFDWVMISSLDG